MPPGEQIGGPAVSLPPSMHYSGVLLPIIMVINIAGPLGLGTRHWTQPPWECRTASLRSGFWTLDDGSFLSGLEMKKSSYLLIYHLISWFFRVKDAPSEGEREGEPDERIMKRKGKI